MRRVCLLIGLSFLVAACQAETGGPNDAAVDAVVEVSDTASAEVSDTPPRADSVEDSSSEDTPQDAAELVAACSVDLDCAARGVVCGATGLCKVLSCTASEQCGSDRLCLDGVCVGFECSADADCTDSPRFGPTYRCDQRLCAEYASCSSREMCAATERVCDLLLGQCVTPPNRCSNSDDCVYPLVCNTTGSLCGVQCVSNGDCGNGSCLGGWCTP